MCGTTCICKFICLYDSSSVSEGWLVLLPTVDLAISHFPLTSSAWCSPARPASPPQPPQHWAVKLKRGPLSLLALQMLCCSRRLSLSLHHLPQSRQLATRPTPRGVLGREGVPRPILQSRPQCLCPLQDKQVRAAPNRDYQHTVHCQRTFCRLGLTRDQSKIYQQSESWLCSIKYENTGILNKISWRANQSRINVGYDTQISKWIHRALHIESEDPRLPATPQRKGSASLKMELRTFIC